MAKNYVMPAKLHNELVAGAYSKRGYNPAEIDGIFFGNALRFLGEALPK